MEGYLVDEGKGSWSSVRAFFTFTPCPPVLCFPTNSGNTYSFLSFTVLSPHLSLFLSWMPIFTLFSFSFIRFLPCRVSFVDSLLHCTLQLFFYLALPLHQIFFPTPSRHISVFFCQPYHSTP